MPSLKPCPFCGANADASETRRGEWIVDCSNQECCAFAMTASPEQWNKRAVQVLEYGAVG